MKKKNKQFKTYYFSENGQIALTHITNDVMIKNRSDGIEKAIHHFFTNQWDVNNFNCYSYHFSRGKCTAALISKESSNILTHIQHELKKKYKCNYSQVRILDYILIKVYDDMKNNPLIFSLTDRKD